MRQQARTSRGAMSTSRATSETPSQANSHGTSGTPSRPSSSPQVFLSRFAGRQPSPASPNTDGTDEAPEHLPPKAESRPPRASSPFLPPIFRPREPRARSESQATAEGSERQVVIPAASRLRPRSCGSTPPAGTAVPGRPPSAPPMWQDRSPMSGDESSEASPDAGSE
ncbi:hypothetical protein DUNSADRAFT_98 [Dunaliella salina]|uniref:Encoded protein n=1 Tax=Dunaliella salina TaxID=3046 RepID=A0ABQ7H8W3_DUNSA|nr:hypothetical protein DUNSADRAFT_98 [Dunaliella salina]|eukprot:KAF5843296.1 hypothetical protein DUNSADRAFT_98 [Dunaliella salina]